MYYCQQCGSDVTAEAEVQISEIVSGSTPGHTCGGLRDYLEKRYVCKVCQEQNCTGKIPLGQLVRILVLIDSPPNLRSKPQPWDRQNQHFDAWFDGGAIVMPTGGLSEYLFDNGVQVSWAGLAPQLYLKIKWPDGRAVTLNQDSDQGSATIF